MRGPFSVHTAISRETAESSVLRVRQELSELGWFNEGSDQLLTVWTSWFLSFLDWIHQETPMF